MAFDLSLGSGSCSAWALPPTPDRTPQVDHQLDPRFHQVILGSPVPMALGTMKPSLSYQAEKVIAFFFYPETL